MTFSGFLNWRDNIENFMYVYINLEDYSVGGGLEVVAWWFYSNDSFHVKLPQ